MTNQAAAHAQQPRGHVQQIARALPCGAAHQGGPVGLKMLQAVLRQQGVADALLGPAPTVLATP